MSETRRGDHSALRKIEVTCETCGVSESFYSNMSVERFKAQHRGHTIIIGGGEEGMPSKADEVDLAPKEKVSIEGESGMRLPKVRVDLIVFPALRDSVFRVRGFKDDMEEAFVATSRFENGAKVRKMLESGEYVDYEFSGLRYVWESSAIEYEGDARERLGMPAEEAKEASTPEPELEPRGSLADLDESSVARTNEILFADLRRVGPGQTGAEPDSVLPAQDEKSEVPAPPSPPPPAQEQPPEPELIETQAPPQTPPARSEKKIEKAVETASKEVAARPVEEADDANLLVSKSWYIHGGTGNRKEAARISKVLKAFRWKVEPISTIGVILDDLLSIETSKNQISRTLIKRVEDSGYRLTAGTTDQGKPVAWFKKAASVPEEPSANEPGASDTNDDESEFEADVAG